MWEPQHEPLGRSFRVITPDLRGYGQSPATPGTVTMRQLASDVEALLDELGIDSAAVVGLSMGGLVAMELAIANPGRWWALGLVATTAEPVTEMERCERLAMAETLETNGMEPIADSMSKRLFGPRCPQDVVERVVRMMRANNPQGAAAALDPAPISASLQGAFAVVTMRAPANRAGASFPVALVPGRRFPYRSRTYRRRRKRPAEASELPPCRAAGWCNGDPAVRRSL